MFQLNRFLIAFLSILFITKIIVWQVFDEPIGRGSMLVIVLLILVLKIQNRLTWFLGMSIILSAFLFRDWMLVYLEPVIYRHIFLIMDSLLVVGKTPLILAKSFRIIPAILFHILLIAFLTRTYRVKYGISKTPNKWNFWNRIF